MKRYYGSDRVKAGFYWTPARWEIVTVPRGGGMLPGGDESRYHRIPIAIVIPLGALLGALYVIFLPLIGFIMFFGFAGKKLWHLATKGLRHILPNPARVRKEEG